MLLITLRYLAILEFLRMLFGICTRIGKKKNSRYDLFGGWLNRPTKEVKMSYGGISVKEYKSCLAKRARMSRFFKKSKHKRERQRVRQDINVPNTYKKFSGWFW